MKNRLKRAWLYSLTAVFLITLGCTSENNIVNVVMPSKMNGVITEKTREVFTLTLYVADQDGRAISGIQASQFEAWLEFLSLNTIKQSEIQGRKSVPGDVSLQKFSATGKPISVGLVLDRSGSMSGEISNLITACSTFVNQFQPGDQGEIWIFDDIVENPQTYTSDVQLLLNAINSIYARGSTALYYSIVKAVESAALQDPSKYSKAVISFSDGGENASPDPYHENVQSTLNTIVPYGIPVFGIALGVTQTSQDGINLDQIVNTTGGFSYYTPNATDLADLYNRISQNIRNSYIVRVTWPVSQLPPSGTPVTFYLKLKGSNKQIVKDLLIP